MTYEYFVNNLALWHCNQHLEGDLEVCEDKLQLATQKLDKVNIIQAKLNILITGEQLSQLIATQKLDKVSILWGLISWWMLQTESVSLQRFHRNVTTYINCRQHKKWKRSNLVILWTRICQSCGKYCILMFRLQRQETTATEWEKCLRARLLGWISDKFGLK